MHLNAQKVPASVADPVSFSRTPCRPFDGLSPRNCRQSRKSFQSLLEVALHLDFFEHSGHTEDREDPQFCIGRTSIAARFHEVLIAASVVEVNAYKWAQVVDNDCSGEHGIFV